CSASSPTMADALGSNPSNHTAQRHSPASPAYGAATATRRGCRTPSGRTMTNAAEAIESWFDIDGLGRRLTRV
ncbi:MAG TPA: hypothetical protein VK358_03370, partial [Longimicrobium sp.]|nr:hypothetical protein [Longimicrobium sp.]